ncbi:MAG: nuclear transport factor 2 family protein [Mycobacteriaceae bacterium]|jgi:3-phenylpropionate/cinnamic acid dioxygenase small subunit
MSAEDRFAITDLVYRYAELIDAGDFDGMGALLARAEFGGASTPTMPGANVAGLFAMTTRLFPDHEGPGTPKTRHLVLNLIVEVADDATAAARSTFCVVQATDQVPLQPIIAGRYRDRFARDDGGWYFTERIIDVEMVGDVSDHLLIDHRQFDGPRQQG